MTEAQQKLVDETVANYLKVDEMRDNVKSSIDKDVFLAMGEFLEDQNNYKLFIKNPYQVMNAFIVEYMKKNGAVIDESVVQGEKFGEQINNA